MKKQNLPSTFALVALVAAACGGQADELAATSAAASTSVSGSSASTASTTGDEGWDPKPELSAQCEEGEEISLPPREGKCMVELRLNSTTYLVNQGLSDPKGELHTRVTAEALDTGETHTARTPESGYSVYSEGERKKHRIDLGTYEVKAGESRSIRVCADFVEHDFGGINGGNDTATSCTVVPLHCDPVDGQPTFVSPILPGALCGDAVCLGLVMADVEVMRADADFDDVPNDVDFTPEPCDEANKGQQGIGLILYLHFDDDWGTTFFQSGFSNLSRTFGAYDRVYLVMDQSSNPLGVSNDAFDEADAVYEPSRDGLLAAMRDMTAAGMRFDVNPWSHGTPLGRDDSYFATIRGGNISGDWLVEATEPDAVGTARGGIPIVAFWSTTCYALSQIDAWREIGAIAVNGAEDVQFFPTDHRNFVADWVFGGATYQRSVRDALTVGVITETNSLMVLQGSVAPYWCIAPTVLGNNACAEDFFNDDLGPNEAKYDISWVYDASKSGAENMQISSYRYVQGVGGITFGAPSMDPWP